MKMGNEKKKYTIYDIAEKSGYSPKTVSRVVNGGENVKKETFEKIRRVMEELSYTPNAYAQNLTKKDTTNILISVKKMDSFPLIWFQTLLDKVLLTCKHFGVNAIVEYFGDDDRITDSIIFGSGSLVDGVVVFYEGEDDSRIHFLKKNRVPFIIFGKSQTKDAVFVSNDDFSALYQLMAEISANQLKKVWMLMGGESLVNKEREKGARAFLETASKDLSLKVVYGLTTIGSIYDYVSAHLHYETKPDVIFVSGDEKVQGLIRACYENKIQIPDDVKVVGFDNIPISQYYTPALSTIAPDYLLLAQEMIERLLKIIEGQEVQSIELPTIFVKRQSL